jgi:phage baseplate assembly protein W
MELMYHVLVQIQTDIKEAKEEQVRTRLTLNDMRAEYGLMLHHLGSAVQGTAEQNKTLDALRARIERIEKRLEIID